MKKIILVVLLILSGVAAVADASLRCHQSQYTGDEFDSMIGDEAEYGTIFLREFIAPETKRNSLFGY